MSESLVERILRLQAARDRAPSQPAAPTTSEGPRTATAETLPGPSAPPMAPQPTNVGLEVRMQALAGARNRDTEEEACPVAAQLAKLRRERLHGTASGINTHPIVTETSAPVARLGKTGGMGAANSSHGKHVKWSEFKRSRLDEAGAATRRAPMQAEDSDEGSDDEVDDMGISMGPMGEAPIERMEADNRKAATDFVRAIGNVDCARRHFKDHTIEGTQGDLEDYLSSIAASSRGYITMCKGRAIKLEEYLTEKYGEPDQGTMRIHGHVSSRAIIGFLDKEAKKGKTARQGAEAQVRKLQKWGFDFAVDTEANASARKTARKPTKRDAKPANPLDLDMVAHIGYGVADASLTTTQRGCFAQMEIMQQGVLRHVNANRCGELTDVKEDGVGINPDFLVGRVAVDAKKAQDKMYDKPFCAVKRTFTGFEYGPTLFHSLKGVTHLGFLVRDLSAPSANPFEEGCTFIDKPMDRNRTLRMLGHLLRAHVTSPDGRKQRPANLERLVHLGVQAARHVLPAAAGARFEPRRAIREIGIWSKSAAEETTVPGMGRLADLVTTAWGKDPDEDGSAHTTPDQYAQHGTNVALPGILLRQHRAISALILQHAADLTAISGAKGWKLLHEAAWPTGFQRATVVSGCLDVRGGQPSEVAPATAAILAITAAAGAVAAPATQQDPTAAPAAATHGPVGAASAAPAAATHGPLGVVSVVATAVAALSPHLATTVQAAPATEHREVIQQALRGAVADPAADLGEAVRQALLRAADATALQRQVPGQSADPT